MSMKQELHDAIVALKAYWLTGEPRRVAVSGEFNRREYQEGILIKDDVAVAHLDKLKVALKAATEKALDIPELQPTAALLATAYPPPWMVDDKVVGNMGGSRVYTNGKPFVEFIRVSQLDLLERALDRMELCSQQPLRATNVDEDRTDGPRTAAMTKTAMTRIILGKHDVRPRQVSKKLERYGLQQVEGQLYTLRLDTMSPGDRKLFEGARER